MNEEYKNARLAEVILKIALHAVKTTSKVPVDTYIVEIKDIMQPELTPEEYQEIVMKLVKILSLYKNNEITTKQTVDKIFDYFFVQK